jgi:hypothetical protein
LVRLRHSRFHLRRCHIVVDDSQTSDRFFLKCLGPPQSNDLVEHWNLERPVKLIGAHVRG